jgi:hypothetical protein
MHNVSGNENRENDAPGNYYCRHKADTSSPNAASLGCQFVTKESVGESFNNQVPVISNSRPDGTFTDDKTSESTPSSATETEINIIKEVKERKNLRAKKRKKTKEEVKLLEAHFESDPEWTRKTVKSLKSQLHLSVDQIYKWGYDRKNLLKKQSAQSKAKKNRDSRKASPTVEISLEPGTIADFNKEVRDLCHFDTGTSSELNEDKPSVCANRKTHRLLKFQKESSSFNSKETHPGTLENENILEDDPFFYNVNADTVFYVVNRDSNKVIPHRRAGKKGLFRIPSGFFNMDFYTYKEEAFKDDDSEFLEELYNKDE